VWTAGVNLRATVPMMVASTGDPGSTELGMGRGKVFPASKALSLLSPARRLVQSPTRLASRLGVSPSARVLELGCGPGYFSPSLVALVPEGELVLADLQSEMLALARNRVASSTNVRVVQADATRLPFATATFDAVVIVLVLGEVPDRDACVAECRRLLRSGGVVLFAETRRDGDFIRRTELCSLVEPHGFGLDEFHGWSWEYTARFRAC
jgi:ubiquinone/menaquinone biosynthesis C-methylase UbiE